MLLISGKLVSDKPGTVDNEIHARVAVLNRFTELGRPLHRSYVLNLAQLGALCLSNICAIKPLESNLETSYKLLFNKLLSICINIQHLIFFKPDIELK